MEYKQVTFYTTDETTKAVLIAELSEASFEGFEEQDDALVAFISSVLFDDSLVLSIADRHEVSYQTDTIPQQNWNATWESNFQPVVVQDFCTIRADFHKLTVQTPYEIVITPKMSFGTGHHTTTQLMIQLMRNLPLAETKVLDFGTGTGILAILAEKLGATDITAIDNDEWSYTNTAENIEQNQVTKIKVRLGSLEIIEDETFDVILANINRHILLTYMEQLHSSLAVNGKILMSGLLSDDREVILASATKAGLQLVEEDILNNWIVLLFIKS